MDDNEGWWEPRVDAKSASAAIAKANNVSESELQDFGDIKKVIENSCTLCDRLLKGNVTKIVPPKYFQDRDKYVKAGLVWRRLMCLACYNSATIKERPREKIKHKTHAVNHLSKSLINAFLMQ